MTDVKLDLEAFTQFISEVYGEERKPFPWQKELMRRALSETWPETIAVPTGAGKTSAIDIAVFAMAACEGNPLRRVFFAVDRRVVVQESYESACALARKLREATQQTPVLFAVSQRLRELAGRDLLGETVRPLEVSQLRGGIYRENTWARSPLQPVVITTTVDQVGSRLLYRGYGQGPKAWAVQAGLVGNDSLIILDEAHCSNPFRQTLNSVKHYAQWGEQNPQRRSRFVFMSATPDRSSEEILELGEADKSPEALGPRLYASKLAQLSSIEAKGRPFAQKLVELAESMARDADLRSVGILVNRVATAREVFRLLKSHNKLILTGRMRQPDRDRKYSQFKEQLVASPDRQRPAECIFTVATQCIEVGANLDFEGMVTECASLDSLRQRFGRLDRLGLRKVSPARVVIQADQAQPKEPDPIYGAALPTTWRWLQSIAKEGVVDFGIEALKAQLPEDDETLQSLQLTSRNAPVLLPAYLDRWAQTSPPPRPDPDTAIFLHGTDQSRPDVSVLWRADLDYALDAEQVKENLSALLPSQTECAPVPRRQFFRWLAGKEIDFRQIADLEVTAQPEEDFEPGLHPRRAFLWRGPEDPRTGWVEGDSRPRLRPGDVLVVSALDITSHKLADFPEEDRPHWDLGDFCQLQTRRKCSFRLHRDVLALLDESWCAEILEDLENGVDYLEDPERLESHLERLVRETEWQWLRRMAEHWLKLRSKRMLVRLTRESWVLSSRQLMEEPSPQTDAGGDDFTQVDDSSSTSTRQIRLKEHCNGVARLAAGFARGCGLNDEFVRLFQKAGALHDVGKADPRFQAWLFGGNSLAQQATGQLWAKSSRNQTKRERERARLRAGYPLGGRHELVSARIAQENLELWQNCADADLLIHLIASHHGNGRPFCPVINDDVHLQTSPYEFEGTILAGSVRSGFERLDSGQAERFWRLIRRYGWWGLAWLESLLVLADHLQSEREREADDRG